MNETLTCQQHHMLPVLGKPKRDSVWIAARVREVPGGDAVRGIDVSVREGEASSAYGRDWLYNALTSGLDDEKGADDITRTKYELSSRR